MILILYLLFAYFALPGLILSLYQFELTLIYPSFIVESTIANSAAGLYLSCLFMTHMLFGSRPKWLERSFGLNIIIKIHAITTIATLFFLVLHRNLHIGAYSFSSFTGYFVGITTLAVVFVSIFLWLDTPFSRLPLVRSLKKLCDKKLQYQHYRIIHNLMALAAVVAAIHINISSLRHDSPYTLIILDAYIAFCLLHYILHKFIKPVALKSHSWQAVNVESETHRDSSLVQNVLSIYATQTGNQKNIPLVKNQSTLKKPAKKFRYRAGQFGFVQFTSGALATRGEEHPFSFSSSPSQEQLCITIQDDGDFTHKLQTECKEGDTFTLDGPYGVFCPPKISLKKSKNAPTTIVGIAGGVGITPYISWLEEISRDIHSPYRLILIWLRSEHDDPLVHRVMQHNKNPNIDIHLFSSKQGKPLAEDNLLHLLQDLHLVSTNYYICASRTLISHAKSMLIKIGVPRRKIHTESFSM